MAVTAQLGSGVRTNQPFPERQLGAAGWRKKDLLRWMKEYEHKIGPVDENIAHTDLVKVIESYQLQGKLPELPGQTPAATSRVAELERQVAELRNLLVAQAPPMGASSPETTPPVPIEPEGVISGTTEVPEDVSIPQAPSEMSWAHLRAYAKEKFGDHFQLSWSRDVILEKLNEIA